MYLTRRNRNGHEKRCYYCSEVKFSDWQDYVLKNSYHSLHILNNVGPKNKISNNFILNLQFIFELLASFCQKTRLQYYHGERG
jgi:hypothetical protein